MKDATAGPDPRSGGAGGAAQLQALLADRFHLTSHRETREVPVYAVVKARGEARCGGISEGFGRMSLSAIPISVFLQYLAPKVNRVIVDRTGLTGNFDIELQWTPDNLPPRPAGLPADQPILVNGQAIDPNGPPLFTALQEQLGLKLDGTRAPVEVLVVDRVEQPSPD